MDLIDSSLFSQLNATKIPDPRLYGSVPLNLFNREEFSDFNIKKNQHKILYFGNLKDHFGHFA